MIKLINLDQKLIYPFLREFQFNQDFPNICTFTVARYSISWLKNVHPRFCVISYDQEATIEFDKALQRGHVRERN